MNTAQTYANLGCVWEGEGVAGGAPSGDRNKDLIRRRGRPRSTIVWGWVWDWDWVTQGRSKRHPRVTHGSNRGSALFITKSEKSRGGAGKSGHREIRRRVIVKRRIADLLSSPCLCASVVGFWVSPRLRVSAVSFFSPSPNGFIALPPHTASPQTALPVLPVPCVRRSR
jgi:hypothetical protein